MKEVAWYLEFIKYKTLKGKVLKFITDANVDKVEKINNNNYIQLSNNLSFTFKSILIDYADNFNKSLNKKELRINFAKSIFDNSGHFLVVENPDGLMTPTIIDEYVINGIIYKRYIFLAEEHPTYLYEYQSYNDWYNHYVIDSSTQKFHSSLVVLIDKNDSLSIDQFNHFLGMSFTEWKSIFDNAVVLAKSGNFNWFSLYDPRIYEFELSIDDRKIILNYMVTSLTWIPQPPIIPSLNSEKEELFSSLVDNISEDHLVVLYDYMFTIDSNSQKTNFELYKDEISDIATNALMIALIKGFYKKFNVSIIESNFMFSRLYPIGFSSKNIASEYFNLETHETDILTEQMLGVKYDIDTESSSFDIKIMSAVKYVYNFNLQRIEYRSLPNHQNLSSVVTIDHPYDRILYITPFKIANQIFRGFDIPVGCVLPIPAFALPWINGENESIEGIEDIIRKLVNTAGFIFPFFKIVQFAELAEIIGFGLGIIGTILDEGLQNQIEMYDNHKSANGEVCTTGRNFFFNLLCHFFSLWRY